MHAALYMCTRHCARTVHASLCTRHCARITVHTAQWIDLSALQGGLERHDLRTFSYDFSAGDVPIGTSDSGSIEFF